jgi:hypothetical protein
MLSDLTHKRVRLVCTGIEALDGTVLQLALLAQGIRYENMMLNPKLLTVWVE